MFSKWSLLLPSSIQVVPFELKGRGKRVQEVAYQNFSEAIDDIFDKIGHDLADDKYALFGHSLGAKIIFELAHQIFERKLPKPSHLFFSGSGAPHVPGRDLKEYSKMSDAQFVEELLNLGGTPKEFFNSEELMDFFIPILRSDFLLAEECRISVQKSPLPVNITVFAGKEEELESEQLTGWTECTTKSCSIHFFDGGHFFINSCSAQIARLVGQTLILSQNQ